MDRASCAAVSLSAHGYVSVSIRELQFVGIGLIISVQEGSLEHFGEEVDELGSELVVEGVGEVVSVSEASDVSEPSSEVVSRIHRLSFWVAHGAPIVQRRRSVEGVKLEMRKCPPLQGMAGT